MTDKQSAPGGVEPPEARKTSAGAETQPSTHGASPEAAGATISGLSVRPAEVLEFLRQHSPEGPWLLTAITPDGPTETALFGPADEHTVVAWVERNARRNLHYHANPVPQPRRDEKGRPLKGRKTDVREVRYLHVDVDPRVDEHPHRERERIRSALAALHPSLLIDSGGGFQALFRLTEPIPLDGTEAAADEAARYNHQLALDAGGDIPARDVSRLLRLPGTVNWPNAKKQRDGRQPAPAMLVAATAESFALERFRQAPAGRHQRRPSGTGALKPADLAPFADIDAIPEIAGAPWGWLRVLIVQGHDPDDAAKYPSRSEALYAATCGMVRAGCSDETVLRVLLDPGFAISASVLEKPKARQYAERQLSRAQGEVVKDEDDPVAFVNKRYFAALEGAKVAFYREEPDGIVEAMQASAFDFELAPHLLRLADGDVIPYSKLWKVSPRRRYFPRGFVLDATGDHNPQSYNLWKGFSVEPAPGGWPLMRQHIKEVLADGNEAHADYIVRWAAWSFQNPATPARVALVFKGGEGVGKGVFCNAMADIFGVHGMRVQNMLHLAGRFNAHLRHCCLLFADEAIVPDSDHEGALKGLITEPTIPIERKGVDVVDAENHLHVVLASNNDWVIPAGIGARRFAVFRVSDCRKGDAAYFSDLYAEIAGGGLSAMLHELLHLDLKGWTPEIARPETAELSKQKARSLSGVEKVWFDMLQTGTLPGETKAAPSARSLGRSGSYLLPTLALVEEARRVTRRDDMTANKVADVMDGFGFEKRTDVRPRGYEIPPLPEARARWDEKRFPAAWDDAAEWYVPSSPF